MCEREKNTEKDFYILDNYQQKIVYHAPSGEMAVIAGSVQTEQWNDQLLYKKFPELRLYKTRLNASEWNQKLKIIFISSKRCNLECGYCFAHGGIFESPMSQSDFMSGNCYKKAIEYLQKKYPQGIGTISFFGGEPLLQYDEIKKFIVDWFSKLKKEKIEFPIVDISTNATLITEEKARFFKEYNIKIALSLDGPKDINDMGRKYANGMFSVAEAVSKGIDILEKYQVEYHIQMVVHRRHLENYKSGMAVKWLKDFERPNCKSVAIAPVVTEDIRYKIEGETLLKVLECFARDLTNEYMDQMVTSTPHIQSLEMIAPLLHIVKNTYHEDCHAGYNLTIETDGNIYPCQMFCGNEKYILGNVFCETFDDEKARSVLEVKRENCVPCKRCIAKSVCAFWCKGLQNLENGGLNNPIECRCRFEKAIVTECVKRISLIKRGTKEYQHFCENMRMLFGGR